MPLAISNPDCLTSDSKQPHLFAESNPGTNANYIFSFLTQKSLGINATLSSLVQEGGMPPTNCPSHSSMDH
jgi:hypothetical protein